MPIPKSIFSSLKVIALVVATDKELHPKEKAWFLAITRNHGANFTERAKLQDCLHGRSTESLEEILSDIHTEADRVRLLNFVRVAMRQDGIVRNAEIQFFYKIEKLLERTVQNDQQQVARLILKHDRHTRVWREVDRFAKVWGANMRVFGFSGHFYYTDGIFWESLYDFLWTHKYVVLLLALIFALGLFLMID